MDLAMDTQPNATSTTACDMVGASNDISAGSAMNDTDIQEHVAEKPDSSAVNNITGINTTSITANTNNGNSNPTAQNCNTTAISTKQKQPRKRKCPSKDTILISVPLHVTADLGVALRRTRKKREGRIKRWLAQETGDTEQLVVKKKAKQKQNGDDSETDGEADRDLDSEDDGPDMIRKEQFGSIVDYLQAKYSKGVSISEYNSQGERVKGKKGKKQPKPEEDRDGEEGEEHYDSDQDDNRSVYGDDGFIDDSLLQEEVVDQVFASDFYGKTKIEMETKRKRKEKTEGNNEENDDDELSTTESNFDDGFFVNIGDLEMEEGWKGDDDVVISPVKRKPGRPKKSEQSNDSKPKSKKRKVDEEAATKKKKKKTDVDGSGKDKGAKSKGKKKDSEGKTAAKKKSTKPPTENGKKKQAKQSPSTPKKSPSPKPKDEPKTPKSIMDTLAKQVKRKFNICVKMIGELTPKQLPRKAKIKTTAKITVSVPADKSVGDTIMFENPHIPDQRLKVVIPAKANMETRTFFATVPLPQQSPPEPKENNIPKELKEALYNYSTTYDEWVNAKAVHISTLPEGQREEFKPNSEKLKKFDKLVTEFPTNLSTPIDKPALRIIVRRMRTNKNKAQARASASSVSPSKDKSIAVKPVVVKEEKVFAWVKQEVKLDAPQKGNLFSSIIFDRSNFI